MTDADTYYLKLLEACATVVDVPPLQVPHSKTRKAVAAKRLLYDYLYRTFDMGWIEIAAVTGHWHPVAHTLAGPQGVKRVKQEQREQVAWWMQDVPVPEELRARLREVKHER